MANNITDKINKIFSEEINKNRNLTLTKHNVSNKLIRNKFSKDPQDNYDLIKNFNKRQSGPENLFTEKKKFINENNDNDISCRKNKNKNNFIKVEKNFNSTIKKILKKDINRDENNYYIDNNFYINETVLNRKKTKKAKFNLEENYKKENNIEEIKSNEKKLKRNRTNTKRNLKNITMIEKQKYPKKETVFDRIKGSIKESNNEIDNDDNISVKKRQKKRTQLKSKRPYIKSIKTLDSKFKLHNSIKLKKNTNMIKTNNDKRVSGENDSTNFLKMNMDLSNDDNNESNNSNEKTIKTNKSEKTKKSKKSKKSKKTSGVDEKDKESNFFESSKFSEDSDSNKEDKNSDNNKEDIFINKNSYNKNKLKNLML